VILGSTIDCKRIKLGEVNQRKTYVAVYTDSKGIRELGEELLNTGATKHFLYRVDGDADALLTICLEILRSNDQFMGAVRNHLDKMKPVARGAGDLCFGVRGGCENLNAYMDGVLQQYDSKDGAANADINGRRFLMQRDNKAFIELTDADAIRTRLREALKWRAWSLQNGHERNLRQREQYRKEREAERLQRIEDYDELLRERLKRGLVDSQSDVYGGMMELLLNEQNTLTGPGEADASPHIEAGRSTFFHGWADPREASYTRNPAGTVRPSKFIFHNCILVSFTVYAFVY
jgi:hypothetical protein